MTEPVDLRLGIGVLVGWVAVLWGLGHSGSVVGVAAGAAVLATVLLAWQARRRPVLFLAAFAACCVAALLAPLAVRLHHARDR